MKSTQPVKKTGFSASSGIKAGDCFGGCFPLSENETIGIDCQQCPPETPHLLCMGNNTSCNENSPTGDYCECV